MTPLSDIAVCRPHQSFLHHYFFSEVTLEIFLYPRAEWVVPKSLLTYFLELIIGKIKLYR